MNALSKGIKGSRWLCAVSAVALLATAGCGNCAPTPCPAGGSFDSNTCSCDVPPPPVHRWWLGWLSRRFQHWRLG